MRNVMLLCSAYSKDLDPLAIGSALICESKDRSKGGKFQANPVKN